MVRFDLRCPDCGQMREVEGPLGHVPIHYCHHWEEGAFANPTLMEVFHGNRGSIPINLGFVESRYATKEDANIAKYQFEHL